MAQETHPIHTLPTELLARLFFHCLPCDKSSGLSPTRAPLVLTRVCGSWRAIALATPELWSRVALEVFHLSPKGKSDVLKMLAFWFHHAKAHPLELSVRYRQPMEGLAELLLGNIDHCTQVDLFLHATTLAILSATVCLSMSEYGSKQELRHLRRLSLGCLPASAGSTRTAPITLFANAPQLTDVALFKIPPSPAQILLPWAQLTSFSTQCSDLRSALGVLRLAPALESMRIDLEFSAFAQNEDNAEDEGDEGVCVHENLASLTIHTQPTLATPMPIRLLVANLATPALRSLILPTLTPEDAPVFTAFAERAPRLQKLTIALAKLPLGALCAALRPFVQLHTLELSYANEAALCELFDGLAGVYASSPKESSENEEVSRRPTGSRPSTPVIPKPQPLLPDLRALHVDGFRSAVPYAQLAAALSARLASFSFTMTTISPKRVPDPEVLQSLEAQKARGMTISVEHLLSSNAS